MSSSEEFQQYKKLYYIEGLPVVDVTHQNNQLVITFKDGDLKKEISGSADDFLNLSTNFIPTVRDGVEQFIELDEVAVPTTQEYYRNMELFGSDLENPIDDAAKRLQSGEVDIPEELDWREALDATLTEKIDNSDLRKVVENYHEALAIFRSDKRKMESMYHKIRNDKVYDEDLFYEYYFQALSILENRYLSLPPYRGYKEYRKTCKTDIEYLSSNLMYFEKDSESNWKALKNRKPNSDEDLMHFQEKPRTDRQRSEEIGKVERDTGIRKILDQYAKIFEIAREPLRDIATTLDRENADLGTSKVLKYLKSNEAQSFSEAVEPQMRHGSAHNQIELDETKCVVKFFNSRGKDRTALKEIEYDKIPERYYEIYDMVIAMLIAFSKIEYHLGYRYMGSREFQFLMLEQMDSNFVQND